MDVAGKAWGMTSKLFMQNNVEVCRIQGKKGGKSSIHRHTSKISMFFVESGSLLIAVEKNDYNLTDKTILLPQQSTIIKPNEYHSFEVLEDCVVYEFYWVTLESEDIERRDVGSGPLPIK